MAVIKDSKEAEERREEMGETRAPEAGTFEEVQEAKARLFHSRKEAFDVWGIRNHLLLIGGALLALLASAFIPFITRVEDSQALVVPAQLVTMEALKEGKITEVFVKEGESVQQGQVIARIVNSEDERRISEVKAESKLAEARLRVLDAKRIYLLERYEEDKRLSGKKVISRDEFEKTELSFRTLEEERRVLKAEYHALGEKLLLLEKERNEGTVTAPIQGSVISDIQEKYGTYAEKGDFLLTLASPDQRLEFFLAEEDWGRVDVGDPARIKFYPIPGKTYRGRVVAIKHYAEPLDKHGFRKNFIKVSIDVEDFPKGIRNGMTAKVRIKGRPVSLLEGVRRRIG